MTDEHKLIQAAQALVDRAQREGSAVIQVPRWLLKQLIERATIQQLEATRDMMADNMNTLALEHGKEVEQLEARVQELEAIAPPCRWYQDEVGDGEWLTACGGAFCVLDGTPKENKMHWCCYCGGRVEVDSSPDSVG